MATGFILREDLKDTWSLNTQLSYSVLNVMILLQIKRYSSTTGIYTDKSKTLKLPVNCVAMSSEARI